MNKTLRLLGPILASLLIGGVMIFGGAKLADHFGKEENVIIKRIALPFIIAPQVGEGYSFRINASGYITKDSTLHIHIPQNRYKLMSSTRSLKDSVGTDGYGATIYSDLFETFRLSSDSTMVVFKDTPIGVVCFSPLPHPSYAIRD